MRIVVDTNVLISAVLKKGSVPSLAVRLAAKHSLLKSIETEQELRRVIEKPYLQSHMDQSIVAWLDELFAAAQRVDIVQRIEACRDVMDNKFLELALNGRADILVSGDRDLLSMINFEGIPIITPAVFIKAFYS
jgi:uncharacterized protein